GFRLNFVIESGTGAYKVFPTFYLAIEIRESLLHGSEIFLLLLDDHVIDCPRWAQICIKNTDARAWFDRGRYGSSILIIYEPGPEHIKPLRIRTIRANDQCSGRLIPRRAASLACNDGCRYCYSINSSQRSRCPVIPCAFCGSLRKRRRCNEHASESDKCLPSHGCLPVVDTDTQGS